MNSINLSNRFKEALLYAINLHSDQVRKGTDVPYVSHLLAVSALVMEDGGDEDEVIAALLHDAPEDQGGRDTLEEIRDLFGEKVAEIVDGCTDTYQNPKPPWRHRKESYIESLETASQEVLRVSLADKLHNSRSLIKHLRQSGESVWQNFKGGKEGTLWYYQKLLLILFCYQVF